MQKILFPMPTMNITTGINELTHRDSLAIDCAGEDRGIDNVHAPFTGIIKKKWANGNTVWLESTQIVLFADGTKDYATCAFTHDNFVGDLSVGQIIKQGQVFYQEGTAGNSTGNHIHLEVARGKFTGSGWHTNSVDGWVLNNQIEPWKAFWLDNVKIINGHNYKWSIINDMVTKEILTIIFKDLLGRSPDSGAITHYVGKYSTDFTIKDVHASSERKIYLARISKPTVVTNTITKVVDNPKNLQEIADLKAFIVDKKTEEDKLVRENNTLRKLGTSQSRMIADLEIDNESLRDKLAIATEVEPKPTLREKLWQIIKAFLHLK